MDLGGYYLEFEHLMLSELFMRYALNHDDLKTRAD